MFGDLINLPNHCAFIRLMLDGQRTRVFANETLPLKNVPAQPKETDGATRGKPFVTLRKAV